MKIVLDTNVLVSGLLLSPQGARQRSCGPWWPAALRSVFDERILSEYRSVLARRKFGFDADRMTVLLEAIGQPVLTPALALSLPDPSDEAFVEVAVASAADCLVTGNLKHFPAERLLGVETTTPRAFCDTLARQS